MNLSDVACNKKLRQNAFFLMDLYIQKNQKAHIKVIKCRNQGIFRAIKGFKVEMKQFVFVTDSAT